MPLTKQDEFVSLYARVLILTTQLPNYQEYTKSADNGTRKQFMPNEGLHLSQLVYNWGYGL